MYVCKFLSVHHAAYLVYQLPGIVLMDFCAPTCADPLCAVNEDHWDDRVVVCRLDQLSVVLQVLEHMVVVFRKQSSGNPMVNARTCSDW